MTAEPENLSLLRNLKIGSFNIGSALADILGSGVWNRIMIADLGYPATPVSLLLGLNYLLAPLAVWTGQRADHTNFRGYRRLPWIWSGRFFMAMGFLFLAFNTIELAETRNNLWWGGIVISLMMVNIGYALSGSNFTTLIYERAPEAQRGRAIGVAWTLLLAGFAFSGVLFARLLPEYSLEGVATLFTTAVALMTGLWFFSVFGEERRQLTQSTPTPTDRVNFWDDFRAVWSEPRTRLFFLYIGLSFVGAFAQDQILEPFGAELFNLSTGETSRFAAFWGSTALLGSVFGLLAQRRISSMTYSRINKMGLWALIATFILLTLSAFGEMASLVRPTLLLFGVGLGLWNIGTWGLMVKVTSTTHAGTYFGLWTMASLLFRGGAAVSGGILRDVSLLLTDSLAFSYGLVFALEGVAVVAALVLISRMRFDESEQTVNQERLVMAMAEG